MSDQYLLSLTLIALLGLFIWGKVRYDALAIGKTREKVMELVEKDK